MKINHDFHIHTFLSGCGDKNATVDGYIENAKSLGLTKLGFANHFWDQNINGAPDWYKPQNFDNLCKIKDDLKRFENENIKLYFGCETEYDYPHRSVALTPNIAEQLDYVLVPNSHTHITMPNDFYNPYTKHKDYMTDAYYDIINSDISRYITAIAHPFEAVNCPYDNKILIEMFTDGEFKRMFSKTAEKGIAIEINVARYEKLNRDDIENYPTMRMFKIAKAMGCKFIFGSDAHRHAAHTYYKNTDFIANLLELKENDITDIAR